MSASKTLKAGILLALTAYAFLAAGDSFLKMSTQSYPILYVGFFTNLATIATLLVFSIFNGGPLNLIRTHCPKLQLLRGCIFLGVYLCFLYAVSQLPITLIYPLFMAGPFIVAILAHFIVKETVGLHRVLAIIGGFTGVMIILRPGYIPLDLAIVATLAAVFLFACQTILVKFMDERDNWMSYSFYIMLVQTPVLGAILLFTGGFDIGWPDVNMLPWLVGSGMAYAFGLALMPLALHKIDASLFSGLEFSMLVWGTLFGYFLFAEVPDGWTIAGALVIVSSGIYLVYRERQANFRIKDNTRHPVA